MPLRKSVRFVRPPKIVIGEAGHWAVLIRLVVGYEIGMALLSAQSGAGPRYNRSFFNEPTWWYGWLYDPSSSIHIHGRMTHPCCLNAGSYDHEDS